MASRKRDAAEEEPLEELSDEESADEGISEEFAKNELLRFCELVDTEIEEGDWKEPSVRRLVRAIREGRLTVDERGQAILQLTKAVGGKVTKITFYEPKGAAFAAIDDAKGRGVEGTFNMLAKISKTTPELFSKLELADTKVCTALSTLFFV